MRVGVTGLGGVAAGMLCASGMMMGHQAVADGDGAASSVSTKKPNIIFFIADDMMPYMFGYLPEGRGRVLTPTISRFAKEGVIMENQHMTSPVCTPSRFTCLTGRYPSRSKFPWFLGEQRKYDGQTMVQWTTYIKLKPKRLTPTLMDYLKKAGYVTGMAGKTHFIHPLNKDWTKLPYSSDAHDPKVIATVKKNYQELKSEALACGFDYAESLYLGNPIEVGPHALAMHNLDWIAQGAVDFIEQNKDKPFYLYVASTIPHDKLEADKAWNADPLATTDGFLDKPLHVLLPRSSIPKRIAESNIIYTSNRQYDEIADMLWMDDLFAAITNKLKELGLDDNTIIFFFNDQGQTAKGTIYQGGVGDPSFVWKKGGFKCGHVSDALVSNIDFVPTILDMAGVKEMPEGLDGKSFLPVLDGEKKQVHDSLYFELGFTRGVRKGKWKYIALRYPDSVKNMSLKQRKKVLADYAADRLKYYGEKWHVTDPMAPFSHIMAVPGGGDAEKMSMRSYPGYYDPDQLYDLEKDPGEQVNLAKNPEYAGKLEEMKKLLKKYLDDLPGNFAEFKQKSQ